MRASDEGKDQNTALAATHARQSWKPKGVSAANSLVDGIVDRLEKSVARPMQLSDWYYQIAQRVSPWPGWSPMSLEFGHRETQMPQSAETRGLIINDMESVSADEPQALTADNQPSPQKEVEPLLRKENTLHRPSIRLAILQPEKLAASGPQSQPRREEADIFSHSSGAITPSDAMLDNSRSSLPIIRNKAADEADQASPAMGNLKTRVIARAASSSRVEIRGGYPSSPMTYSPGRDVPVSEVPSDFESGNFRANRNLPSTRSDEREAYGHVIREQIVPNETGDAALPVRQDEESPTPLQAEPKDAVEKLIEQTDIPTPMPGLEIRMVSPQEQSQPDTNNVTGSHRQQVENSAARPIPDAVNEQQQQINIQEVADKVYDRIMRRQRLERERKGLR